MGGLNMETRLEDETGDPIDRPAFPVRFAAGAPTP
jgi:hypothetical protein